MYFLYIYLIFSSCAHYTILYQFGLVVLALIKSFLCVLSLLQIRSTERLAKVSIFNSLFVFFSFFLCWVSSYHAFLIQYPFHSAGTFGQVLECWDKETREMVAIKVVRRVKKFHEAAMIEIDVLQLLGKYDRTGSRWV